MKTTKPISTISYNSIGFLIGVLERLEDNGLVSFWAFIPHEAEEDERKAHCHVYIEPANAIDTIWLKKQFIEPDPSHPKEPLGCLPINKSKFVDWYWYGLHDKAYLASKNQSRKHHYLPSDMIVSDTDLMAEYVRLNPNPKAELLRVTELIVEGYTPIQIAMQLNVPVRNLRYFMEGLQAIASHMSEITYRNGNADHEQTPILEDKNA